MSQIMSLPTLNLSGTFPLHLESNLSCLVYQLRLLLPTSPTTTPPLTPVCPAAGHTLRPDRLPLSREHRKACHTRVFYFLSLTPRILFPTFFAWPAFSPFFGSRLSWRLFGTWHLFRESFFIHRNKRWPPLLSHLPYSVITPLTIYNYLVG